MNIHVAIISVLLHCWSGISKKGTWLMKIPLQQSRSFPLEDQPNSWWAWKNVHIKQKPNMSLYLNIRRYFGVLLYVCKLVTQKYTTCRLELKTMMRNFVFVFFSVSFCIIMNNPKFAVVWILSLQQLYSGRCNWYTSLMLNFTTY